MHAATLARRTSFSDFSPGSGRCQCRAIARSTGERCRRDAVQGVSCCASHRGLAVAVRIARKRNPKIRLVNATATRRALAAVAFAARDTAESEAGEGLLSWGRQLACQKLI